MAEQVFAPVAYCASMRPFCWKLELIVLSEPQLDDAPRANMSLVMLTGVPVVPFMVLEAVKVRTRPVL
ncbi:hypothetical protein CKW39_12445 [Kocuria sp. WRN011]|nr:hypothetical protein CKW39_12445 [Kocuria sp. WRN011]